MKKVLSTAFILGALYGTAHAAPITSPIYMPEKGEILSTLDIGYTIAEFDKVPVDESDKLNEAVNISLYGQVGLKENLSMNYKFNFDFARKMYDTDASAKFNNFYLGLTGRIFDFGTNKMDILLNVGQEESLYGIPMTDHVYVDLVARYGLEFDFYNLALSAGIKYINDYEDEGSKVERDWDIHFALENEFIFTEKFTIGLDMYYDLLSKHKITDKFDPVNNYKIKAYDEYGFAIDANYGINENSYIGLYFDVAFNDISDSGFKDVTDYQFGLKLTSNF